MFDFLAASLRDLNCAHVDMRPSLPTLLSYRLQRLDREKESMVTRLQDHLETTKVDSREKDTLEVRCQSRSAARPFEVVHVIHGSVSCVCL